METEALAKKVKSELDRWSREDDRGAQRAGNVLVPKRGAQLTLAESDTGIAAVPHGAADGEPFVKEPPIDLAGAWHAVFHCNFWWVAGYHFLHPCNDQRAAEKLCARLREEWGET